MAVALPSRRDILQVRYPEVVTAVPLVQQAVDPAVKGAEAAWLSLEVKGDIKGSITRGLDQDQLSERHDFFVFPHLGLFELTNLI